MTADLVTLAQVEVNTLGSLLFATIGELQRDAQPSSLAGEPIIHKQPEGKPPYDAAARAKGFAEEIMGCVQRLETCVRQLPTPPDEAAQMQRIRELQAQSEQLSQQLQQEQAVAEVKLRQAQEAFGVLAAAALAQGPWQQQQQQQQQQPAAPGGAGGHDGAAA